MELSGPWRAAPRSPELDRSAADPDLDDDGWALVDVPGHWGQSPAFADDDGPIVYRRRFAAPALRPRRRSWLTFDGVMSDAEVWLDGHLLGDIGVYYAQTRFDITDALGAPGTEHTLAVEVACSTRGDGAKSALNGAIGSGPLTPSGSPGGIWRPVRIVETGPVAIREARLLCVEATDERAVLQFRLILDAAAAGPVRIDTSIVGPDTSTAGGVAVHELASGENRLEWTSTIDEPSLWWPASLGDQPRYDVGVAIRTAAEPSPDRDARADDLQLLSDRRHWRTGLRTVSVSNLAWAVNGRRLFVKGIAIGPHHRFLGSVDPRRFVDDVRAVRDAGLDLIRVQDHLSRPELYEAADDQGVLIWQDLPLVGTYAARAQAGARATARAAVDAYGHHPSIALWCGHDEPNGPPVPEPASASDGLQGLGRRISRHLLPSWNRSVLDPLIRRELRSADPSRPVITRSGSLPSVTDLTGSDSHLWLGWRTGRGEDLAEIVRRWPRLGTFVSAIGAQSASIRDWGTDEPSWPTAERGAFDRYIPRGAYGDGQSWSLATRAYQAEVVRVQIETLRRLKYRPTGGFCVVSLFDAEEAGGFGVLDADRVPKPAYAILTDACRPVVVIGDAPPAIVTPGNELSLAIHAVNDRPEEIDGVTVTARARIDDWSTTRRWQGRLDADGCALIGHLDLVVPSRTGALVIDLELDAEGAAATNRYQTVVIPPSEAVAGSAVGPVR